MNNKITEILENVQKCCEIMEDQNFVVYQKQDILKVLDYITNLQEENVKLLHENISIKSIKYMVEDTIYKSRCEKAIKYINLTGYGTDFSMNAEEVDVLFNILKGENNDI